MLKARSSFTKWCWPSFYNYAFEPEPKLLKPTVWWSSYSWCRQCGCCLQQWSWVRMLQCSFCRNKSNRHIMVTETLKEGMSASIFGLVLCFCVTQDIDSTSKFFLTTNFYSSELLSVKIHKLCVCLRTVFQVQNKANWYNIFIQLIKYNEHF